MANIENEIRNTGVFSIRRKKQLQEELQSNASIAERLYRDIQNKKTQISKEADKKIKAINNEAIPLMQELAALEAEERSIIEALNKNY